MSILRLHVQITVLVGLLACLGCRANAPVQLFSSYSFAGDLANSSNTISDKQLFLAATDELRDSRFRLDRVDQRAGVITTYPEGSQHFFECWRHDVDTTHDFWEATINPIRRWTKISIKRNAQSVSNIEIEVRKERFSAPDRQFSASGASYNYFSYDLPATTGEESIDVKDERWIDVGRDPAMEHYLLTKILHRAGVDNIES